jgi:hypothetical protein
MEPNRWRPAALAARFVPLGHHDHLQRASQRHAAVQVCCLLLHSLEKEAQSPLRDAKGERNSDCSCAGRDVLSVTFARVAVRGTVTLVGATNVVVPRNACTLLVVAIAAALRR